MRSLPTLLLTGGPAAGKTVTGRALAEATPRCAYIDVDDLRQLVRNGGAPPWAGEMGRAQHLLGVRNAAALAENFTRDGFTVTMSDVIDAELLATYRRLVPGVVVIKLSIDVGTARVRARMRPISLTETEFETLHRQQQCPLEVDDEVVVSAMTPDEQVAAVLAAWIRCRDRGPRVQRGRGRRDRLC